MGGSLVNVIQEGRSIPLLQQCSTVCSLSLSAQRRQPLRAVSIYDSIHNLSAPSVFLPFFISFFLSFSISFSLSAPSILSPPSSCCRSVAGGRGNSAMQTQQQPQSI